MTNSLDAIKDDIAYVKSLAVQGRGAILGGWISIAAGSIFGIAALVSWGVAVRVIPLHPSWQGLSQLVAMVVFVIAATIINARTISRVASGRLTIGPAGRVVAAAWTSVAFGIFALAFSVGISAWRLMDAKVVYVINPIIFSLYGMAWLVSATASGIRWMRWTAYGCFLTAIAVSFEAGSSWTYPIAGAGLFLFAVVPGIALVRDPSSRGA